MGQDYKKKGEWKKVGRLRESWEARREREIEPDRRKASEGQGRSENACEIWGVGDLAPH